MKTIYPQLYRPFMLAAVCMAGSPDFAFSQNCAFPQTNEFQTVEIFKGMKDPSHMAVQPDGSIFAIEQWTGLVHRYTPGSGSKVIGTVPTNPGRYVEDGMLGIVADLNFPTTHWIYILHTPANLGSNRLTRYSVIGDTLANPKIILEYSRSSTPGQTDDQRHAGGGMAWNKKTGDLLIVTGDDTNPFGDRSIYGPRDPDNSYFSALRTAANTNDLRGKSLRIRPIAFSDAQSPSAGVGSTYSIPPGNLFPTGQFTAGKTRPEIYTMGHRNAYRVKVDTITNWVFVGEVGADASDYDPTKGPPGYDKVTLFKGPGNAGWPFTNGNLEPYLVRDYEKQYLDAGFTVGQPFNLNNLKNLSLINTGLTDLPSPPRAPLVYYTNNALQKGVSSKLGAGGETAIAGPTYDFNPSLVSSSKMPPFFHRKVIFGDYTRRQIWLMSVDTAGTLTALDKIVSGPNVIDMEFGPDGSLYYLDYGAGTVYSLRYTGTQKDYKSCSFIKEGCMDAKFKEYDRGANLNNQSMCATALAIRSGQKNIELKLVANLTMGSIEIPAWASGVEIFNVSGKKVYSHTSNGPMQLKLPEHIGDQGLLYVNFLRK